MVTDYAGKQNALMKQWSEKDLHKGRSFIADGIIDYSRWEKSDRKILLLFKEAYGDYDDLCRLIRDEWKGPKYKLWWTVSYWLYAIQKITKNSCPIFPNDESEFDECIEYLLSSAIVNIKKSSGKSSSEYDDIITYAKEDSSLLEKQVLLINPDIILCGYTFEPFKTFWKKPLNKVGNTGFIFKSEGLTVIDFWHPSNHYPNHLCFYALCSILQEAE